MFYSPELTRHGWVYHEAAESPRTPPQQEHSGEEVVATCRAKRGEGGEREEEEEEEEGIKDGDEDGEEEGEEKREEEGEEEEESCGAVSLVLMLVG